MLKRKVCVFEAHVNLASAQVIEARFDDIEILKPVLDVF